MPLEAASPASGGIQQHAMESKPAMNTEILEGADPNTGSYAAVGQLPLSEWGTLSEGILQMVGKALEYPDVAAARLVCTAWSTGIALGVTHLRPKLSGINGLAWPNMRDRVSELFPCLHSLDMRLHNIMSFEVKELQPLGLMVQQLQLSNYERVTRPSQYMEELQALYSNLAALPSRLTVEFELRVAEGAFCHSFHLSDMELAALVRTPEQVALTLLLVTPTLAYNLRALDTVVQLTALRHLHLVTYRADPDDIDFKRFSSLVNLEELYFGTVPRVTGKGMMEGLEPLKHLQSLTLVDVSGLQNAGMKELAKGASALRSLALIKCPWLTNGCVQHFAAFKHLKHLHLENNRNLTAEGLARLRAVPQLRTLKLRMCHHVGAVQSKQLLVYAPNLEQVNDYGQTIPGF